MVDAVPILKLLLGFLADNLLEITHHCRERMRTCDRTKQVVRVFDVGNPVSQSLIDGVLENAVSQSDFHHLGTEHAHASDIKRLTTRIDLAHVDAAFQAEHGTHRSGGHTMLSRAGFSNDAGLTHALDQQSLPKRIVDLVGAGMVEILTLEEYTRVETGLFFKTLSETRSVSQR